MGLDLVELVMETEETFGIDIPDRDAERLATVGALQDYVVAAVSASHPRRPAGQSRPCPSAAVFHQTRRALMEIFELPRGRVTPDAPLAALFPELDRRFCYDRLSSALDLRLPRAGCDWFGSDPIPAECRTVRDLVRTAVRLNHRRLVIAAGAWTEQELRERVLDLIEWELGVERKHLTRDARFIQDLGVD